MKISRFTFQTPYFQVIHPSQPPKVLELQACATMPIMLSEISQTQKDKSVRAHLYVEPKIVKLIETKKRMIVTRCGGRGKSEDVGQRVQSFSYAR